MIMRLSILLMAGWMAVGSLASVVEAAPRAKPNVIIFLVDDMGWIDSTPFGSRYYDTPNMERFAQRAMRFTDAYACPLCSPTRASILTGKSSARHGITSATGHQPPQPPGFKFLPDSAPANKALVMPISKNYMEPSEYTIAEALRDAGWHTAHMGKWHVGLTEPYWPENQGFEFALHAGPDPGPPSYFSPYGFKKFQTYKDGPVGEYITDRLTDEAVKYIEANRDQPFFLNLWHHAVHGPWGHKPEITQTFVGKKDPRGKQANPIMASMLKSVDESLGRIMDKLDELKLTDDTIFIFFSDNGGNTHSNTPDDRKRTGGDPEGGPKGEQLKDWHKWAGDLPPTNNSPLRDGKASLYEGGIRVPLMVSWPGQVKPGVTSDAIVNAFDLYPTIIDALGIKPNPDQKMDGISILPALRQSGPLPRQAMFTYFPHGHPAPGVTVRVGDWKLIRWFEKGPDAPDLHELYNLRDDLSETKNLASAMPDKVAELDARIDGFLKDTGALVPKPNPNYKPTAGGPAGKATRAFGGWQPKGAKAAEKDGVLAVEADGKNPFLGISGLKHKGPVTLQMRIRSPGGAGKVQWRTADQPEFPATGQTVEFTLPAGNEWIEPKVEMPVNGSLFHMRLYLPANAGPVDIAWIELQSQGGKPQRWTFDAK